MDTNLEELNELMNVYADNDSMLLTGSSITCFPPVEDTDIDVVIVYNGKLSSQLQAHGFTIADHAEYPHQGISACYRKGKVNVIAVRTSDDFKLWVKATHLASHLNLLEKHQRVALFQFVTEGVIRGTGIRYHDVVESKEPF